MRLFFKGEAGEIDTPTLLCYFTPMVSARPSLVSGNIAACRLKIDAASQRRVASALPVTLVAVAKGVEAGRLHEAIDAGLTHLGENKIQEARERRASIGRYAVARGARLTWHFIGHLQSNKVKTAVEMFDVIHSVDTLRIASLIDKEAARLGKIQEILLEVNVSGEASKHGFKPDDVAGAVRGINALGHLRLAGFMTMAPVSSDSNRARECFRQLRDLAQNILSFPALSMGMTDDYEVAIEEGATMVRIGRGIFGERET